MFKRGKEQWNDPAGYGAGHHAWQLGLNPVAKWAKGKQ